VMESFVDVVRAPKIWSGFRAAVWITDSVVRSLRRRVKRFWSSGHERHAIPESSPPLGTVRFGDFDRVTPISANFGFERGTPVDRYYIERFLEGQSADFGGRVLEIKDDAYCRRFGAWRIVRQDVLNLTPDNPAATIVGDLCDPRTLPSEVFDTLVLTQTLQMIFDVRAAIAQVYRALRPGGVALITAPGITKIDGADGNTWCWSLTPHSAFRLFADVFGADNVRVESHGNVYAATAFLQGLALEEVDTRRLDVADASYPVIVTVRAQKASDAGNEAAAIRPPTPATLR
jgi:SAM-dependent methyltransferase